MPARIRVESRSRRRKPKPAGRAMRVKSLRAWQQFLDDVRKGHTAFGIDPDFFSLDDLLHLHRARYTAQRVVDLALSKSREGARA